MEAGRGFATLGEWPPEFAAAPNAILFAGGLAGEDEAGGTGGVRFDLGLRAVGLML